MTLNSTPTLTGRILHLQRLSTEDGPGLRTTVFYKGCPLSCRWCHNPESISPLPEIQWLETRCIGCGTCLKTCTQGALSRDSGGLNIDRQRCTLCGECSEACPANALEWLGKPVCVPELVRELAKDRTYFKQSGGGVTLSGGEPTLQPDFTAALLRALKEAGLSTALDTCGLCTPQTLARLLPDTDLVLFDLKAADSAEHQRWTGAPNQRILDNLGLLHEHLANAGANKALWVRTPLIPGATATPANLRAIGQLLAERLNSTLQRWELCAFNNLCRDKYRRLGKEWDFGSTPLMPKAELDQLLSIARQSGVDPSKVFITGAARVEEN